MQKGFIFPSLYIYAGLGAVIGLVSLYAYVQTSRLEACNARYEAFVSETERLGKEAKLKAKQVEAENKLKKEKADDERKKLLTRNADLSKRLRDNASRSFVPRAETPAGESKTACFDQSAIDSAIKRFAERVTGIVEQGQNAVTDLDNARQWASQ